MNSVLASVLAWCQWGLWEWRSWSLTSSDAMNMTVALLLWRASLMLLLLTPVWFCHSLTAPTGRYFIVKWKMNRSLSGSVTSWLPWRKKKEERTETKMHFEFIAVDFYFPSPMDQWESFFFFCCVPFVRFTSHFFSPLTPHPTAATVV